MTAPPKPVDVPARLRGLRRAPIAGSPATTALFSGFAWATGPAAPVVTAPVQQDDAVTASESQPADPGADLDPYEPSRTEPVAPQATPDATSGGS